MVPNMRRRHVLFPALSLFALACIPSLSPASAQVPTPVAISEVRTDQPSTDNDEYIEFVGTPEVSLDGYTLVIIGDGAAAAGSGVVEGVVSLNGRTIPADGFLVLAESTYTLGNADVILAGTNPLNFENTDNVTFLLVQGFTGAVDNDLDTNNDGTLDSTPWTAIADSVALILSPDTPPVNTEFAYSPNRVGPDGTSVPGHVFRCDETFEVGTFEVIDGNDTPGAANDCEVVPPSPCGEPGAIVPINVIQGNGAATPCAGSTVSATGIVTATFTTDDALSGFWMQTPDADVDSDAATSEGIFVFCGANCAGAAVGDAVSVTGVAGEQFASTQINANAVDGVTVDSTENTLPTPTEVALPAAGRTDDATTFEPIEGMLVEIPTTLALSEFFELARFGQLVLTADERPFQFTHDNAPSVTGYADFLADLATRVIVLDDDNNDENDPIVDGPDEPYPYPEPGLSLTNRFRGGDTITGLSGVMQWDFGAWRIRPSSALDYPFAPVNATPDTPTVGGSLTVAAFNVLNYFTTIDTTASNSTGTCGPSGTLDCRGADSEAELVRQRTKMVAALSALDADIFGLIEIQNDDASVDDVAASLNAAVGAGTYSIIDTGFIGTDAIKVGLIYKSAIVQPVGAFKILNSTVDPRFIDTLNRPVLIQTFEEVATGERFTVAVNHFKSKGSACTNVGDPDRLDGQANCPGTRTSAAEALADYLATDPTASGDPDFLIIGDLNSYKSEDPIVALKNAGFVDLVEQFMGDDAYSFLFDGQLGYLDHALANASLASQVTNVAEWHINSDESPLFDYNDTIDDLGEASFERESAALPLYDDTTADPRRSSDHDPVLIGLTLDSVDEGLCEASVEELEAAGYNVIEGTDDNDLLSGTRDNDAILGRAGNDLISGGNGNDLLCGSAGTDVINGGGGNDTINGGGAADTIDADNGNDAVDGGLGNDNINGGGGNDAVNGSDGNDTIDGDNGNDVINGDAGNDTLLGAGGNDTLVGGDGTDAATGAKGTDACSAETETTCET